MNKHKHSIYKFSLNITFFKKAIGGKKDECVAKLQLCVQFLKHETGRGSKNAAARLRQRPTFRQRFKRLCDVNVTAALQMCFPLSFTSFPVNVSGRGLNVCIT